MTYPAQSAVAARLLNRTAEGFEVCKVTFTPSAPKGGNRFATIAIAWTVGPAWGQVQIEFRPTRPGEASGAWKRAEGVSMMPAGFPMLPALKEELAAIAAEAIASAEAHLPAGIPFETSLNG